MTRANHWCREDFLRRHSEAAERARNGDHSGMRPPVIRVRLIHEQEQRA